MFKEISHVLQCYLESIDRNNLYLAEERFTDVMLSKVCGRINAWIKSLQIGYGIGIEEVLSTLVKGER